MIVQCQYYVKNMTQYVLICNNLHCHLWYVVIFFYFALWDYLSVAASVFVLTVSEVVWLIMLFF